MTKDNASGAGMERYSLRLRYDPFDECDFLSEDLDPKGMWVKVSDATRLLAESQAHNAKLEAQVERMRQALEFISEGEPYYLDMQERARAALKP